MFNKVLVAEDMDDIFKGIFSVLSDLNVKSIDQVQYCDDAYLKVKKAIKDQCPYNLLITDLSFKEDYRKQKLTSGEALIKVLKEEHPELKIIAYSVEDRLQKVRKLMNEYKINAYVCKGRRGLMELSDAIRAVSIKKHYVSPLVENALNPTLSLEIDDYDIALLILLSKGFSQNEISANFSKKNMSPSSLSSIEKHINTLRSHFKAKNVIHLVSIVKDLGLI